MNLVGSGWSGGAKALTIPIVSYSILIGFFYHSGSKVFTVSECLSVGEVRPLAIGGGTERANVTAFSLSLRWMSGLSGQ